MVWCLSPFLYRACVIGAAVMKRLLAFGNEPQILYFALSVCYFIVEAKIFMQQIMIFGSASNE